MATLQPESWHRDLEKLLLPQSPHPHHRTVNGESVRARQVASSRRQSPSVRLVTGPAAVHPCWHHMRPSSAGAGGSLTRPLRVRVTAISQRLFPRGYRNRYCGIFNT